MSMIEHIKERFQQLQSSNGSSVLTPIEQHAFEAFNRMGIPTGRHEEWKYTRISSLFKKEYSLVPAGRRPGLSSGEISSIRLPGHKEANEVVFINGIYSAEHSIIRSEGLVLQPLEKAAENEYRHLVSEHLGHSSNYVKDGIHALNTAFVQEGIFIHVPKSQVIDHPVYLYYITDSRSEPAFSQPRSLVHIDVGAQVQLVEKYSTIGPEESFTNQVMEVIVEKDAVVHYYKIQNDATHTGQVSTTHFHQVGRSTIHAVTITLDGGMVRNNLNIAMDAAHSEAHLYGLYFLKGTNHVDNHTIVDNLRPSCLSNELYKGIVDDESTAVFNGKIFVQPLAQKTN